jgi:hypothetical protein
MQILDVPGGNVWDRRALQCKTQWSKEPVMTTTGRKPSSTLYADRFTRQWVVRDPEGKFWIVTADDSARATQCDRFFSTEETEFEPVPGHYKHLLGVTN